jgi:hypothetical protein
MTWMASSAVIWLTSSDGLTSTRSKPTSAIARDDEFEQATRLLEGQAADLRRAGARNDGGVERVDIEGH